MFSNWVQNRKIKCRKKSERYLNRKYLCPSFYFSTQIISILEKKLKQKKGKSQ